MPPIDPERLLAAAQLGLAMFGMGAVLRPGDFAAVVRDPRGLWVGIAVQLAAVPLVAWGLGRWLPVPAGIAAGLILMAAVPGGTLSNVFTYLVAGNVALSVALTGVTTFAALLTTPIVLRLLLGADGGGASLPVAAVARDIVGALLLPLGAGMAVGGSFPARRDAIARWAVRASLACILGLAVLGGAEGKLDPRAYGPWGLGAVGLLALAAHATATTAARAAGLPRPDVLAIAVEATIRNTNLALLVQTSLAADDTIRPLTDGMFFVALLYGGVALPVACLPLAGRRITARRRR